MKKRILLAVVALVAVTMEAVSELPAPNLSNAKSTKWHTDEIIRQI